MGAKLTTHARAEVMTDIDQVRFAVVQNALVGVAREMGTIMERASYSSILNEGKDFSCAVFNPGGELVAEGEFVLVHLAAMHEAVQVLIEHFGDQWEPGDIAIHNDPYEGGSHLPDINLVRPVLVEGTLIAYVATRAHYPDVGGIVPGSFSGEAKTLFAEGIVIPPLLLARSDVLDEQLISLWSRNVRVARRLRADLMAQVASVRVGEKSLLSLCERVGAREVREVLTEIPEYGEAIMRSRIEARLAGEEEFFDFMDDAGPDSFPVRIHVRVSVDGSRVVFDYSESDAQVPCPINAPPAVVKSATYGAMKCLLVPELPLNSGMFRPIEVVTAPGSVTHPKSPAPVAAGNTNTSQRIFDACLATLGQLSVGEVGGMAASYSANNDTGIGGYDRRTEEEFVLYMMPVGGIGARPDEDGESALINYMGNCSSQPVEVWESMYPLRVNEYRLRNDSAGAGRRRGGLGLHVSYTALEGDLEASLFTERQRFAPFGLALGQPGELSSYTLRRGEERVSIPTKVSGLWLRAGDTIEIASGGGGGYGDPFAREVALVARDVREGFVSPANAEVEYGVVCDARGEVDRDATEKLRATNARTRSDTVTLRIDAIDPSLTEPTVVLGEGVLAQTRITPEQVLYCFSERRAVYARAAIVPGLSVALSSHVARTLHLEENQQLFVRPLRTEWRAYSTDDLRRAFGMTLSRAVIGGEK
jgi:N-methylhydantoinase B